MLKSCLSQTTAHGLANVVNEPRRTGKWMWLILTLCVMAGFILHSSLLYRQWLEEQVSASTHPNSIPFIQPDIVFCSERILARDVINNPQPKDYEFMRNVSNDIVQIDSWYRELQHKSSAYIWDSLNLHRLFKAFFHRRIEFFLNITCNFKQIDVNDLIVEPNIVHLACYRLTPAICPLKTPMNSLITKFYNHIHGIKINYKSLNVFIDNKTIDSFLFAQKEYVDEMEDGVHIYFVQPNELIHKSSRRVSASPNAHTDIRITSVRYDHISTSKSKCKTTNSYQLVYNLLKENISLGPLNLTTSSSCVHAGLQRILFKEFRCVSTQFPIPMDIPANFTFCGSQYKRGKLREYIDFIKDAMNNNEGLIKICSDMNPCRLIKHHTIVSYSNWPRLTSLRSFINNELATKLNYIKKNNLTSPGLFEMYEDFQRNPSKVSLWTKNIIKVSISPDEFMSTEVVESQSYSFKNFFSDTGGILGFYMGASILTLCEVFRLLHNIAERIMHNVLKSRGTNSMALNNDFV